MTYLNTSTKLLLILMAVMSISSSSLASGNANRHGRASAPMESEQHVPKADITKSCSSAKDKDFCINTLKSNPQSAGCDIRGLTYLSMDMAQKQSTEVDGFISTKLRNEDTLDDNVDDALNECSDVYDDATAVIEDAISAFFQKNFNDMKKYMTAAMSLGDKCQSEFSDDKSKAFIGDKNLVFSKLCGITLALLDRFDDGLID
ncbi:hypothetical protein V2J09_005009 [Rumex salicifolius]